MEIDIEDEFSLIDQDSSNVTVVTSMCKEDPPNECENCGDRAAVFCSQCDSYYCNQCSNLRHKHIKRKDHSIKFLEDHKEGMYIKLLHLHSLGILHLFCPPSPSHVVSYSSHDQTASYSSRDQQKTIISGVVARKFKLANLHSWQESVIAATLNGRDSLVVQPTGAGKSLCYTVPPLCAENKTAIIISPTISLMTDQVSKLEKQGILATLLGSAQTKDVLQEVLRNEYRLVFCTPESFYDRATRSPRTTFLEMAKKGTICLIAVDEAHLISRWQYFRYIAGNSMCTCVTIPSLAIDRSEYSYLNEISSHFPNVPLMMLTATATPHVRDQLETILRNPVKEIATVNKPNIALHALELKGLPRNGKCTKLTLCYATRECAVRAYSSRFMCVSVFYRLHNTYYPLYRHPVLLHATS